MSVGDNDARLFEALAPYLAEAGPGVILAVSGGPDSVALMHAAAKFDSSRPIFVATVDHGLRRESRAEADSVAALAQRLSLVHHTLHWAGPKPESGLQSNARAMRYRLLQDHAAAIGARLLLTAHHADDQAETIVMRLIAGSGPAGLAGMRKERALTNDVRLARPFLSLTKAELVAYCEAHGLAFARDPSNADDRFLRARLRVLMPLLAAEGLSAARLGRLAGRLARDECALFQAADRLAVAARRPIGEGRRAFDGVLLLAAPEAVVLRLIDTALDAMSECRERPHTARLERLERLVLGEVLPTLARRERIRRTLRGVLIEVAWDGRLILSPAPPRRVPHGTGKVGGTGRLGAEAGHLLGKAPGAAYIGETGVASSPAASDARDPASPDRGQ